MVKISVHPRACGERSLADLLRQSNHGSSPRLRGTESQSCQPRQKCRFIPAPAGNGLPPEPVPICRTVHPRACGERGLVQGVHHVAHGSSPRLRGTVLPSCCSHRVARFIPAPAGNGRESAKPGPVVAVHPRACGEREKWGRTQLPEYGSSPRLRGTVPNNLPTVDHQRFIPAPAGNGPLSRARRTRYSVHPRACGER